MADAGNQHSGSGGRRMDEPYPGPEDRHGISAHGVEGETDLRNAKEYAEMIVDTVREGLLVLDFDLRIEAANESFYRMFEVPPGETEGRLIYELGSGQWDIPELRELLEEILPENKIITGFEVTHDFEGVGRRTVLLNARQLDDHQKILLAVEDISEQEEAHERLRTSEEKLRKMNRSLEERVEQRTAELQKQTERLRHLAAELASAEQRERRRLAALLHDELQQLLYGAGMQLTVARGKSEGGSPVATAIDEASERIGEAIEAARDLTRQLRPPVLYEAGLAPALKWLASEMVERHGLEVTVDQGAVDPNATERALSDDVKAMLFDCARELLFNVVKHAGADEARVALQADIGNSTDSSDVTETDADRLRLIVEDEGRGFDVETASPHSPSEKPLQDGDGFGLLSIRERIAALGGATAIESSPGEGTRVELAIPLAAAPDEQAQLIASARGDAEDAGPTALAGRDQVRVIIVDDHAVVRQGIANLLADDERLAVVGEAADGHEAVGAVERHQPDAVLVDVNMPRMNGIEATRRIHRRWPDTAVIGMSVQVDEATEQAMLDAGAAAFVPKSGDADHLIETILRVAERLPSR